MTVVDLSTEAHQGRERQRERRMWERRDMLVDAIRRIDAWSRISPDGAVIVWLDRDEDGTQVNATVAAVTLIETVYMLADIKQDMLNG